MSGPPRSSQRWSHSRSPAPQSWQAARLGSTGLSLSWQLPKRLRSRCKRVRGNRWPCWEPCGPFAALKTSAWSARSWRKPVPVVSMASMLSFVALNGLRSGYRGAPGPWCGAVTARAAPEGFIGRQRCESALLAQERWRAVLFEPGQGEWSALNTGKWRVLRHECAVESEIRLLRTGVGLRRVQRCDNERLQCCGWLFWLSCTVHRTQRTTTTEPSRTTLRRGATSERAEPARELHK